MKYQLANNEDAQYVRGSTNVSIFNMDTSIKTLQTDKQDKNFVVTFTPTWQEDESHSFTATADKTFAETLAAYNAGKTVMGVLLNGYNGQPVPLSCCYAMSDGLQFVQPCVPYGYWACGIVWQADGTVLGLAWTGLAREDADTSYASINGSDSSDFNAAQLLASSVKINNVGTLSLNAPNIQLSNSTGNGVYTFDSQKTGTVAVTSDIPDISGKADTTTVNAALALKADASSVYTKTEIDTNKQDILVSGTNIKTLNGNSLLGSGDIEVSLNEIDSITAVESSASGGNNVVTITDTDGNSTSFNVKNGVDGADGVNLGDVALVQTTGNATDSVMSQKAVSDALPKSGIYRIAYSSASCFSGIGNNPLVSANSYDISSILNVTAVYHYLQVNGLNKYTSTQSFVLALRNIASNTLVGILHSGYSLTAVLMQGNTQLQSVDIGHIGTLGLLTKTHAAKIDLYTNKIEMYAIIQGVYTTICSVDISGWDLSILGDRVNIEVLTDVYTGMIDNIRLFVNDYINIAGELDYTPPYASYNEQAVRPQNTISVYPITDFILGGTVVSTISTTHKISNVNNSNTYFAMGPYDRIVASQYFVKFQITSGTCSIHQGAGIDTVDLFDADFNFLTHIDGNYYTLTNDTVYYLYVRCSLHKDTSYTAAFAIYANGEFTIETLDAKHFMSQNANLCAETYDGTYINGCIPMEGKIQLGIPDASLFGSISTPLYSTKVDSSGKILMWNGTVWKQINNS